jgi:hypothetical protein
LTPRFADGDGHVNQLLTNFLNLIHRPGLTSLTGVNEPFYVLRDAWPVEFGGDYVRELPRAWVAGGNLQSILGPAEMKPLQDLQLLISVGDNLAQVL